MSEIPEFQVEIGGETISIPAELPLLPVRNTVLFPGTTLPLSVGRPRSTVAVSTIGTPLLAKNVESPRPTNCAMPWMLFLQESPSKLH